LREAPVRTHGFAGNDVHSTDDAGNGSSERDLRWWLRKLPALDDDRRSTCFDGMIVFEKHLERASLDSAAHHRPPAGVHSDAAKRENRFLKITGLGHGRFDAQVFDPDRIQGHDLGTRFDGWLRGAPSRREERQEGNLAEFHGAVPRRVVVAGRSGSTMASSRAWADTNAASSSRSSLRTAMSSRWASSTSIRG